ncbi:MAG: hypothetical protein FJY28_08020 [Betaproteobacteria bacterium]|nr:hypothetical protein [Betaproteobacteria bacterium]
MRIHSMALVASLLGALTLSACSPAQNWRDVAFEGSALKAQLPCKPDRTTRSVPLGGVPVDLQVAGCESGTAMVALMSAALPAGADAGAILSGWQKATLDNARVAQPLAAGQQQVWHRPGHLPLTSSQRIQANGLRANGDAVAMDAVWGAVAEGDRLRLVHAVVYDRNIRPEMANTLFESIKP